jgi:hypothetical protein
MSEQKQHLDLTELSQPQSFILDADIRVHEILTEAGGVDSLLRTLDREIDPEERAQLLHAVLVTTYASAIVDSRTEDATINALEG